MERAIRNAIRRIDSRESFAIEIPIFVACQADSPESLEFPIRANHPIRANRANRFARITPLSFGPSVLVKTFISCYRTPGPQKGFRRVSEGFQKGSLKGSLKGL